MPWYPGLPLSSCPPDQNLTPFVLQAHIDYEASVADTKAENVRVAAAHAAEVDDRRKKEAKYKIARERWEVRVDLL